MIYETTKTEKFSEQERQQITESFIPRIKFWVMRIKRTLPEFVETDELYSSASLGFIEALDRFDKSRNVAFATYAERRIKGAIMDSLRGMDFLPRNVRTKVKSLESTIAELSSRFGRQPTYTEIAQNSDFSIEEVYKLLDVQEQENVLSLDEKRGDENNSLIDFIRSANLSPEDELLRNSAIEKLTAELDNLPDRERLILSLYYYEELTMKEIAEILDLTESRVSQIHTDVSKKLKWRLASLYG